jgi:RNA polymerase sigma-70 factor (ECF subfamily)
VIEFEEDHILIDRFLTKGDVSAFEKLYDKYADKVYGRCLTFTKNVDDAKDYTQDIFLKIFYNLSKIENTKNIASWIYTLTYRYCIDKYKVKQKENIGVQHIKTTYYVEEDEELELSDAQAIKLELCLKDITPEERSILMMKYKDEFDLQSISELIGVGLSAVKMRLKRTKDKLKEICKKHEKGI